MTPIRAFLAFELPDRATDRLHRSRASLVEALPRARWVRPQNQHLTLKFLGDVDDAVLKNLVPAIRRALNGVGAFGITLGGSGFFPNDRRPRVAWVGGSADGVGPVLEKIEECSAVHGFRRENKPWSPHITQARLNRPWPRWAVDRFLEWGQTLEFDTMEMNRVVLYSSELRPDGAVYTPVERFTLL